MYKLINILCIVGLGLLFGCHDHVGPGSPHYFVYAAANGGYSASTLKTLALLTGQTDIASLIKYNVSSYRLVYQTNFKGNKINASGLILIPDGVTAEAPIISLQHGTTFLKSDAPTIGGPNGMELFASAGYITLLPDFIGYGESSSLFHPYYDKDYSAYAVIDMIRASKEFLPATHVAFSRKLFLAGYSEGGYVTLAAAKEIENNAALNLTVTAAAAGAGGYDLKDMFSDIATNPSCSYPSYLAFMLMAYNTTYDWNKPLTYFFDPRYTTGLYDTMDGTHDGDYVNQTLTTDLTALFDTGFYSRLKQSDGEPDLNEAIAKNDVGGWKTKIPLRLYHGTSDEIIPYHNSEITLQNFKDAGSTTVTLTPIAGGTHGSSLTPMIKDVIPWLITFN